MQMILTEIQMYQTEYGTVNRLGQRSEKIVRIAITRFHQRNIKYR